MHNYSTAARWEDKPEAWHMVSEGVKRRILAHSPTGMMVLYRIEANSVFQMHNHPHAQYGIFMEGGGTFKVADKTWTIKQGDTYFIPPGVMHELKTTQDSVVVDFFTPFREDYLSESQVPKE